MILLTGGFVENDPDRLICTIILHDYPVDAGDSSSVFKFTTGTQMRQNACMLFVFPENRESYEAKRNCKKCEAIL